MSEGWGLRGWSRRNELESLEALRSLGVRERLMVVGTPTLVTAQRFLGFTGVYWGRSLRSLTGVRERECKMQNAECNI